jgi:hypothetical protein
MQDFDPAALHPETMRIARKLINEIFNNMTTPELDLVISFDHTGSMSSILNTVKSRIRELIDFVFREVPSVRIGIVVHNDYGNLPDNLVHVLPLTNDRLLIERFLSADYRPGGQGAVAGYAVAIDKVRQMDWQSDRRVCLVIGDEKPHEKGERWCGVTEPNDWREMCKELAGRAVQIYGVQCLNDRTRSFFYEGMARLTGGIKLDLAQFQHIPEYIMAVVHKQKGTLEDFQASRAEFSTNIAFRNMFAKLRGVHDQAAEDAWTKAGDLLSRFQVATVPYAITIKDFVEGMGISFKRGRSYYQLTKPETVQANKEVVFVSKATGEAVMDTYWCRQQLGLPYGVKGELNPRFLDAAREYDIFIQSNSYNRKLVPSKFLYELDHN